MRLSLLGLLALFASASMSQADPLAVVADVPAVHSLVSAVTGDLGRPDLLISGVADPHDLQLRPSQARTLSNADIVIWVGAALTPWLDRSVSSLAPDAKSVPLLKGHQINEQNGEMGTVEDRDVDPHDWLDPVVAMKWIDVIADALSDADPHNASAYAKNAADAKQRIGQLQLKLTMQIGAANVNPIIVTHDAFSHFAARFEVTIAGAISDIDGQAPSAADLKSLRDKVQNGGITCAFYQPNESPALLQTVLSGSSVRIGILDPVGVDLPLGPDLYFALLENLTKSLLDCNQGTD